MAVKMAAMVRRVAAMARRMAATAVEIATKAPNTEDSMLPAMARTVQEIVAAVARGMAAMVRHVQTEALPSKVPTGRPLAATTNDTEIGDR